MPGDKPFTTADIIPVKLTGKRAMTRPTVTATPIVARRRRETTDTSFTPSNRRLVRRAG